MTSFIKNQVLAFKARFHSSEPQFIELDSEQLAHAELAQYRDCYEENLEFAKRYTLLTKRSAMTGIQRINSAIKDQVSAHPASRARTALLKRVAVLDEQLRYIAAAAADFDKTLDESAAMQKDQIDVLQSAVETVSHFVTPTELRTMILALQDARDTVAQSAKDDGNDVTQRLHTWGKLDKAIDTAMNIFMSAAADAGSAPPTPRR